MWRTMPFCVMSYPSLGWLIFLNVPSPACAHCTYTVWGTRVSVADNSSQLKLNEESDEHGRTFVPDFRWWWWHGSWCMTWTLLHFILFCMITQLTTFPVSTFQNVCVSICASSDCGAHVEVGRNLGCWSLPSSVFETVSCLLCMPG